MEFVRGIVRSEFDRVKASQTTAGNNWVHVPTMARNVMDCVILKINDKSNVEKWRVRDLLGDYYDEHSMSIVPYYTKNNFCIKDLMLLSDIEEVCWVTIVMLDRFYERDEPVLDYIEMLELIIMRAHNTVIIHRDFAKDVVDLIGPASKLGTRPLSDTKQRNPKVKLITDRLNKNVQNHASIGMTFEDREPYEPSPVMDSPSKRRARSSKAIRLETALEKIPSLVETERTECYPCRISTNATLRILDSIQNYVLDRHTSEWDYY